MGYCRLKTCSLWSRYLLSITLSSSSSLTDWASWPVPVQSLFSEIYVSIGQLVGLLGRGISPTQGLYLHRTTQHRKTRTHIHASSEIRNHDPSVRDSTCLRPLGHLEFGLELSHYYYYYYCCCTTKVFPERVKWPHLEVDHFPPSSAQFNNALSPID
jgi:hypothetical protein